MPIELPPSYYKGKAGMAAVFPEGAEEAKVSRKQVDLLIAYFQMQMHRTVLHMSEAERETALEIQRMDRALVEAQFGEDAEEFWDTCPTDPRYEELIAKHAGKA